MWEGRRKSVLPCSLYLLAPGVRPEEGPAPLPCGPVFADGKGKIGALDRASSELLGKVARPSKESRPPREFLNWRRAESWQ